MKFISQMIQDGSFDEEFMPAYKDAVVNNKSSFKFAGTIYSRGYGKAIANFAEGCRNKIETLKNLEK